MEPSQVPGAMRTSSYRTLRRTSWEELSPQALPLPALSTSWVAPWEAARDVRKDMNFGNRTKLESQL